jgi:hypothetical protein
MQWRTSAAVGHNDASNPAFHAQGGSFVKARIAIIALVALFVTLVLPVPGSIGPVGAQQPTPPASKEAPKGGKKEQTAVITMEMWRDRSSSFRRMPPRR